MATKLRLLLFEDCNRSCEGCCNKDWDLKNLPVCMDYSPYDVIMLTGGEVMLDPMLVFKTIRAIRRANSKAKIYIYTAYLKDIGPMTGLLADADGLCVTLHEQADIDAWKQFGRYLYAPLPEKSLRLNIFKGVELSDEDIKKASVAEWVVKRDIEWIKDCPLPSDEVFMRLKEVNND